MEKLVRCKTSIKEIACSEGSEPMMRFSVWQELFREWRVKQYQHSIYANHIEFV